MTNVINCLQLQGLQRQPVVTDQIHKCRCSCPEGNYFFWACVKGTWLWLLLVNAGLLIIIANVGL